MEAPLLFKTRLLIGLDVGSHSAKAAVMSANRREIVDLVELPVFPERQYLDDEVDPLAVRDIVRRLLDPWIKRPRTTCAVAVAVQGDSPVGGLVRLPPLNKKQIGVALEVAAVRMITYPYAEASVGVAPVSRTSAGTSWFLGVVRKQALDFLQNAVERCGLTVSRAEMSLLPLTRAYVANHQGERGAVDGLISVGSRQTTVLAVRDGRPVALRCFRIGGADFTYACQMGLQTTWPEAEQAMRATDLSTRRGDVEPTFQRWLDQVARSVQVWSQGDGCGRPRKLMVTGGLADWKGMAERLAEHTGLPVEADRWDRLHPPAIRPHAAAGTFAIAVGLCLPDEFSGAHP